MFLATDLAHHIRLVEEQERMAAEGYNPNNPRHRQLLLFLLMTAADLNDQTKHWKVSRMTAVSIICAVSQNFCEEKKNNSIQFPLNL